MPFSFISGILVPPSALADTYSAPPGYQDMIIYGLAERLYGMVTKNMVAHLSPYPQIMGRFQAALNRIRRINKLQSRLASDFPGGKKPAGFYDSFVTYTGEPY